jgi:23S rRNA G2069 N7-methylase RlmK/C1962 C5-methylase RlmI
MAAQPVSFLENGVWFEVDILQGQKTGFFWISARIANESSISRLIDVY